MVKSQKKLLKEPDRFITFTGKALEIIIKNKIQLMVCFGIFVFAVILISVINFFSNRSEEKASMQFEKARNTYESELKSSNAKKAFQSASKEFLSISDKYSNTNAAKFSKVINGNICYDAGEYDNAIASYELSLIAFKDNSNFKNLILNSLGYCYEAKKDYQKASEFFEKAANENDSFIKDESLFNLSRVYAAMGDSSKSIDTLKKITTNPSGDHNDFMYIDIVKEKLSIPLKK